MHEVTSSGAQVDKLIEAKAERYKAGIAIYWLLPGATCAAMAWMPLTILVK
jgi:hypothetical protein